MDNTVIQFTNFSFQYSAQQNPTLRDINLTIHKGEKILICGSSGCGKSTLIHCINGLIPFSYSGESSGSLKIRGKEIKDLSLFEISKIVGTVLQDSDGQFVGLTVAEDIAFALENDCVEGEELYGRVLAAARMVHVDDHLTHAPSELSGGQKQRVSLAGIMVDDVDVFLFDEPLANLDPLAGKHAIELIDEISKDTGAAVIIVEHRLEDVLWRNVDRIVLINEGQIVSNLSPDELLSDNLLIGAGIREPLYITAMKYAGIKIRSEMHPSSVNNLILDAEDKKKICSWFCQIPKEPISFTGEELLTANDIDFTYSNGFHALHNISFRASKGELIAIVGKNGAGKSTFSKIICGFENQQKGTLFFKGKDLCCFSIKERADHIGYVMQNPNQMISKVITYDEVSLGLKMRGISEEEQNERIEEALRICGLWSFRNWPISALSYGQKKRVTIASILVLQPEIIILDEPTAGQDYRHYTEIMEFLLSLKERGITVIMITHDMHLMLEYADRAVVFCDGEIIADTSGADVLTSKEILSKADLTETSLYHLAVQCGIESENEFVRRFIDYDREGRRR